MEHRGAHQGRFHSPHRFSEARVRRKGSGAHGPTSPNPYDTENGPVAYARHITSPVTALVGAAERQQVGTGGGSTYRQKQASASKDKRRCNQRQVAGRRRERTDGAGAGEDKREEEQASASKDKRRCNQRQVTSAGRNKREEEQASASKDMRRCNQRQETSAGGNRWR